MEDTLKLYACTGDGVWAVDAEQRIVLWNAAAQELFGYTAGEALGQPCYQLLAGRDASGKPTCKKDCRVLEHCRRGQPVRSFGLQVQCRDGRASWGNASVITVQGEPDPGRHLVLLHIFGRAAEQAAWPPPLRICLLGHIEVQRADGSLVQGALWRRAKVRALLAYLALQRGRPVHRDVLLETLWPDMERENALHNLNTAIYNLRYSLEPRLKRGTDSVYISYEGDHYLLEDETHWLDADAFRTEIYQARREQDPAEAIVRYRQALALYRGDFLSDLRYDMAWYWEQREQLRERYLTALEELATLHLRKTQVREATDLYLKILALDPCHESAARQLMRLAMDRGDRQMAVAHYRHLEQALWHELEMLPSRETCLLYEMALHAA